MSEDRQAHRAFLNENYRPQVHIYDFTRRLFLFGRDLELETLLSEDWTRLVEIGPGTGRNLRRLHARRPRATYGGLEASDEMLRYARHKCPFAVLERGFAESTDLVEKFGQRPERILYSYSLSMVEDPRAALETSFSSLADGGEIVIVDFSDFSALPNLFGEWTNRWLGRYRVHPVPYDLMRKFSARVVLGPGRYYFRARIRKGHV